MTFIQDITKGVDSVGQVVVQIRLRRRMIQGLYEKEHRKIVNSLAYLNEVAELASLEKQSP